VSTRSIWEQLQQIAIVWTYQDEQQMHDFVKAIDQLLLQKKFAHALIIVNVPKDLDKKNLPPHFLIYYNSPADYSLFGKLKDVQLEAELHKKYDLLLWFGSPESKIKGLLKKTNIKQWLGINEVDPLFDMLLNTQQTTPAGQLEFIQQTLQRIQT
jgi:esterase/lipase superfamily enzyme